MYKNFNSLCERLNLSDSLKDKTQLEQLEEWCKSFISQDIHYTGSESLRYKNYLQLAKFYLDTFLVLPKNGVIEGKKVMHYAAYKGYNYFLADAANRDPERARQSDPSGMTPLHWAALKGNVFSVKSLLAAGVLPNSANKNKEFPLHSSLVLPTSTEQTLINRKVEIFNFVHTRAPYTINAVDKQGETVAHYMAKNGFSTLLKDLVAHHKSLVLLPNNHGKYPIHLAILNQQLKSVNVLMALPEMSSIGDAEKRNPLHYAAAYSTAEMVKACCVDKTSINACDVYQKTPLTLAAESNNLNALKTLIQLGTKLSDEQDLNLLDYEELKQNKELAEWIKHNTFPQLADLPQM